MSIFQPLVSRATFDPKIEVRAHHPDPDTGCAGYVRLRLLDEEAKKQLLALCNGGLELPTDRPERFGEDVARQLQAAFAVILRHAPLGPESSAPGAVEQQPLDDLLP